MSEENKSSEYNDEIADKIIKVNQRAKDELVARDFIHNITKDKSYKKKPPTNWRLISIITLGLILSSILVFWTLNDIEEPTQVSKIKKAVFILNSEHDSQEFNDLIQEGNITVWTKDKKTSVNMEQMSEEDSKDRLDELKQYEEMTIPGNYKRLKDFFDYCRLSDISNIHLFGDLGEQKETDINLNNKSQYVIIDKEFWEFFKNTKEPVFKIHDNGKYSNIKERIINRRDEVLNEK
ncbi:MAG: hypothetical protein KDC55_12715 [Ignavibacteriae bacterium]|nr:hypothetical protein [Ignavibacteriota bacterium]